MLEASTVAFDYATKIPLQSMTLPVLVVHTIIFMIHTNQAPSDPYIYRFKLPFWGGITTI